MTWKTAGFARHDGAPRFARAGLRWCALVLGAVLLAGCASGPGAHPDDPLEPYNRSMARYNDGVDEAVLKPVATAYKDAVPSPVRPPRRTSGHISWRYRYRRTFPAPYPEGGVS